MEYDQLLLNCNVATMAGDKPYGAIEDAGEAGGEFARDGAGLPEGGEGRLVALLDLRGEVG